MNGNFYRVIFFRTNDDCDAIFILLSMQLKSLFLLLLSIQLRKQPDFVHGFIWLHLFV